MQQDFQGQCSLTLMTSGKTKNEQKDCDLDDSYHMLLQTTYQHRRILEKFQNVLNQFGEKDFSYLFRRQETLENCIGFVLENWDFLRLVYLPLFERFLDLMKAKIDPMPESRLIYPALYRIRDRLQQVTCYKGSQGELSKPNDHLTDFLFQHYMQELQTRSTREEVYCVKDPKTGEQTPLSELIFACKEFFNANSGWNNIFSIATYYYEQRDTHPDVQHDEAVRQFLQNFSSPNFPLFACMGCSQFFYANHNIYHPQLCKNIVALGGSASKVRNSTAIIKQEICGLLNGGKGGVILFDCDQADKNVIPRGASLAQTEKEEFQQRIGDYLQGIYPKPLINQNIFISWVPMVEDPFDPKHISKYKRFSIGYTLSYIEGLYVARITVRPTDQSIKYYWTHNEEQIFSVRTKSLADDKRKVNQNNFQQECKDLKQVQGKIIASEAIKIDHEYPHPAKPFQASQKKEDIEVISPDPEKTYKYASVMVAKKQDYETIRNKLLKRNIDCVIATPFEKLKLKGASHSAILYFNAHFEELLAVVNNNKEFQFGGRPLLLVLISEYIRLTERNKKNVFSETDFNSLAVWLNKQYPNQTLKMHRFIPDSNEEEYYLETGSKESSVYIYIVMMQFLEKSSFKDPKGLSKMSEHERASRFKKVYPAA